MNLATDSLETKLSRFLFSYRMTPQSTTGQSPVELLFNRQLRLAFMLIKPDTTNAVRLKQFNNEYYSKRNKPLCYFNVNDTVIIRNFGRGPQWLKGKVTGNRGVIMYEVETDGQTVVRYVDQRIKSTPEIHPVVDQNNKFVHPTITVLSQSVPEILSKSNAEDSESKNDAGNFKSITPVDTATEPVKSPIIQKTDTQQPQLQ